MESPLDPLYPFKVWITSLAFAAIIFTIVAFFMVGKDFFNIGSIGEFLFYLIFFSFSFSLPTFIIYFAIFIVFGEKIKSAIVGKAVFSLIATTGMIITFYLMDGIQAFSLKGDSLFSPLIYATSIFLAGFLFKYRSNERSSSS